MTVSGAELAKSGWLPRTWSARREPELIGGVAGVPSRPIRGSRSELELSHRPG